MAKGGVIGNLRVNMGLDSAQFQSGVAKVGKSMDDVAKKAAVFGAAIGAAMAGAAAVMSAAIKRTIADADNMAKSAQKFGVGVEELSRLKHAADLSGVSLDTLGTSLRKLSQNMQETAKGAKNTATEAFTALGVSVKNSDGSLRSSTEVMGDVADRLSRMQDGAQKTALAMAIFGKSGSELIPMLNAGRDGINEMMQEADRLGIVLDTNTAKAAEAFNDNMARLGRVWDGLVMKLTAELLPALETLAENMMDFANNHGDLVQQAAERIGETFQWVARQAAKLVGGIRGIKSEIASLAEVASKALSGDIVGARDAWNAGQEAAVRIRQETEAAVEKLVGGMATSQAGIQRRISDAFGDAGADSANQFVANFEEATKTAGGRIKAAIDPLAAEAARIFQATRTPLEQFQARIALLNKMRETLDEATFSQDTYNRAVIQAQDAFEQAEKAGKKAENTFERIGQSIAWTFSSAFQGLTDGSKKAKDVLADLLSQLGSMMMNSAFQALFSGGKAGGGILGSIFSGLGFRANGGPVMAGRPYIVGERGPELMVPNTSGTVIKNSDLSSGGGGRGYQDNRVITIDARGAQIGVGEEVRRALIEYDREVLPARVNAIANDPYARG